MLSLRFLTGVAVGAAAMAMFDPESGRARRSQLCDQAKSKARRARDEAERKARYEEGRLAGEEAERMGAGGFKPADDTTLAHHLHQQLSQRDVPIQDLKLEVVDGLVRIRGQVDNTAQIDEVVETVIGQPGVRDVESYLHLPGEPAPNKQEALAASARATRSSVMR